jgi:hypothetical protein
MILRVARGGRDPAADLAADDLEGADDGAVPHRVHDEVEVGSPDVVAEGEVDAAGLTGGQARDVLSDRAGAAGAAEVNPVLALGGGQLKVREPGIEGGVNELDVIRAGVGPVAVRLARAACVVGGRRRSAADEPEEAIVAVLVDHVDADP